MKKTPANTWLLACGLLLLLLFGGSRLYAQSIIGGTIGDPSAVLELRSQNQGLLLPRLTSAERTAMADPAEGLLIYNTSLNCVEINLGSSANPEWICLLAITGRVTSVSCENAVNTGIFLSGAPIDGTSTIYYTGGSGGFYDAQSVASTGVTGLTATLSAGALAVGDGSLTYVITGTPSGSGTANFALNIGGQTCTLELSSTCGAYVASGVWKTFMCHNLGANTSADPFTPSWELNGNYYQWGRKPTCFGRDDIDGDNPCSSPVYGAAAPWGNSISNDNAGVITGWSTSNAFNDAWVDGSKTVNDPCPAGWRVPTAAQLTGLANTALNPRTVVGTWTDDSTNYSAGHRFGQYLFLPAAGFRFDSGSLGIRGISGNYWSSTESGTDSYALLFNSTSVVMGPGSRSAGFSLRCIAE